MLLAILADQLPLNPELICKFRRAVPGYGQTRALPRAARREAPEHSDGIRFCRGGQDMLILAPVGRDGQEVKGRPVVPDPVAPLGLPGKEVDDLWGFETRLPALSWASTRPARIR